MVNSIILSAIDQNVNKLIDVMVINVYYCYAECRYTECHCFECLYVQRRYANWRIFYCYAECRSSECRGAL